MADDESKQDLRGRVRARCEEMDLDKVARYISKQLVQAETAIDVALDKIDEQRRGDDCGEAARAAMDAMQALYMIRAGHMTLTKVDCDLNGRPIPGVRSR